MICPNCGTSNADGVQFCAACGAQLAGAPAVNNYNQQMQYQQAPPARRLATNRGLVKFILLSLVTFGIYGIVVMSNVSTSINVAASRYDGKKTMHFCLVAFIFSWLTFGIVPFVWMIKLTARVGNELRRRNINYGFGVKDFWLWGVLGSFIIVGPYIYTHKLLVSMNRICEDYNING